MSIVVPYSTNFYSSTISTLLRKKRLLNEQNAQVCKSVWESGTCVCLGCLSMCVCMVCVVCVYVWCVCMCVCMVCGSRGCVWCVCICVCMVCASVWCVRLYGVCGVCVSVCVWCVCVYGVCGVCVCVSQARLWCLQASPVLYYSTLPPSAGESTAPNTPYSHLHNIYTPRHNTTNLSNTRCCVYHHYEPLHTAYIN